MIRRSTLRGEGRYFTDFDTLPNAQPVVAVDEKFAQRFWPNENPIGKHVWFDPKRPMSIVGVVGTVKQYGLDIDGRIVVYRPSPGLMASLLFGVSAADAVTFSIVPIAAG